MSKYNITKVFSRILLIGVCLILTVLNLEVGLNNDTEFGLLGLKSSFFVPEALAQVGNCCTATAWCVSCFIPSWSCEGSCFCISTGGESVYCACSDPYSEFIWQCGGQTPPGPH